MCGSGAGRTAMAQEEKASSVHLLALVGLAPAVAGETFWALRREGVRVSAISLVTTARGASAARQRLMGADGALARIAALEFASSSAPALVVTPPIVRLYVLHALQEPARQDAGASLATPLEIDDIGCKDAYLAMLESLDRLVRRLTTPDAPCLHASLAGGRKTMAAALTLVMSLHARPQDRMSHVLVSPPYDRDADFLFPGLGDAAAAAAIRLIDAPFVRLRPLLPPACAIVRFATSSEPHRRRSTPRRRLCSTLRSGL